MSAPANSTTSNHGFEPAFRDAAQCEAWLETQPMVGAVQMQTLLNRQLGLLNRATLTATDRFGVHEALRQKLSEVQAECSARYAGKPLPLAPPEQSAFNAALATWRAFADGYLICLKAMTSGDEAMRAKAGTLIQRTMAVLVDMQLECYRSGRNPESSHWHSLHQCYETAEKLGVHDDPVKDRLRSPDQLSSVNAVYGEALLLHTAVPSELSARHLNWVSGWSRRWGNKLVIGADKAESSNAKPLYVTLDSHEPASYLAPKVTSQRVRLIDTSELRHSIKKRQQLLAKGDSPASLQLGEDCIQPAGATQLHHVDRHCCKGGGERRHQRLPAQGGCEILCGIEDIYTAYSGGKKATPAAPTDMDKLRRERERMATFGGTVDKLLAETTGIHLNGENWRIVDQSTSGLRLARSAQNNNSRNRVAVGMLLAVQSEGMARASLGTIRWAVETPNNVIEIGVELIPGQPIPVTVSSNSGKKKEPALLLPPISMLKQSTTLLTPAGLFEAGKVVGLNQADSHSSIRLGQPLLRGFDFDRVMFSEVDVNAIETNRAHAGPGSLQ